MAKDEAFEALMASVAPEQTQGENSEMEGSHTGEEATGNEDNQSQENQSSEMEGQAGEQNDLSAENKEGESNEGNAGESQQSSAQVDYNEWLKNETAGLFDSVDSFKASLDKFKDYDAKATRVAELEKNQLPEDTFIKKVAEMRGNGASKDQIMEFIKLNTQYDDFSVMTPKEQQVAKLVLIDGYSKSVAERKVDREFPLSDLDEGSEEYLDMIEEQRISAKSDLAQLESYKAKLSTTENKEEQTKLENIALQSAHADNVKQSIPSILGEFKGLGSLDLTGKVGKDEVASAMAFDFDDEFSKKVPQILEFYFNQEIAPITPERIQEAKDYINAAYLHQNWKKISNDIYLTALAVATEKAENKFVNNKGVQETAPNPNPSVGKAPTQAELEAFGRKVWGNAPN